nr:MAG TPA: hypothetical protein [Caudoviricetes sp.]
MQLLKDDFSGGSNMNIVTEHLGEKLYWSIRTYRNLDVNDNIVRDINNFWSRLPMETQGEIFNCYRRIYTAFEEIESTKRLDVRLLAEVKALFEHHPFEQIMQYFNTYASIKLPADLKDYYVEGKGTPELTYLRKDHYELIGLTILMKIMLPIWGTYIETVHSEAGNNFKEYRAAALLRDSNVIESSAYKRLLLYISTYWEGYTNPRSNSALLAGLSDQIMPNWLLGCALIRRIAPAELIPANYPLPTKELISHTYNYIEHLVETMDKVFGGRVNDKQLDKTGNDEDNISVAENYKIKQEISEAIIVTHEIHITHHTEEILKRLDPTCPVENLREVLLLVDRQFSQGLQIHPLSKAIVQWTLHPVVNARILDYVSYDAVVKAFCVAYTLLKHWGFKNTAIMVFAQPEKSKMMSNTVRHQITAEQMEKLDAIYPHTPNDTRKRQKSQRKKNVAMNAIDTVIEPLYGTWWRYPEWENEEEFQDIRMIGHVSSLPYDIEIGLANLLIHLKTNIHPPIYKEWREQENAKHQPIGG